MPLTPEEVQNKEFTTVRLREGYDMQEVDDFLDEVETELTRLYRENDELREKLGAVTRGGSAAGSAAPITTESPVAPARETPTPPPSAAPAAYGAGTQPSDAAAKVLALAQKTADELVADAKSEAERLLSDARARAEKLDADTRAATSKLEAEARQRAESVEAEVQARRAEVFGKLEAEKADLDRELETLRSFEHEYRSRLKSYLENELRKLEVAPVAESEQVEYIRNDSGPIQTSDDSSAATSSGTGSLRSVASLLEDDQR
jgi:DivIVA domain-containing protein